MYKILLVLLLFCLETKAQDENKFGTHHYVAGFIVGSGVGILHKTPKEAFISSTVTGFGIGVLKEVHDMSHGQKFSKTDFLLTGLGAITSGLIIKHIKRKITKLKQKRK